MTVLVLVELDSGEPADASLRAVSMRIGVCTPFLRRCRHTSKPLLDGSITSSTIRSNVSLKPNSCASRPSAELSTV